MAPISTTTATSLLVRRYYYYTSSPGLPTGAIIGISIASILILVLLIGGFARRARYGSYYGSPVYQQPVQPYAYRTADGQPIMPIYATASGNPAYPQTELGQVAPRAPDAAMIATARGGGGGGIGGGGQERQPEVTQLPMYTGSINGYYAPKTGAGK